MPTISRDDAIDAVRLWGLASYRYHATAVLPPGSPDELHAGLRGSEDPVELLEALAEQITQLADSWRDWIDQYGETQWSASA